jgi:hypothetical protein
MPGRLSVLVIGSMELTNLVRDALVLCGRSRLAVAASYWELCSPSLREAAQFQVAILDVSFSDRELRRRAEYIRQRWADAAILLVRDDCDLLDDPLYDERIPAGINPEQLAAVIERLVGQKRRASENRHHAVAMPVGPHHDV